MTPDQIDKWKPEQIGQVFRICTNKQQTCGNLNQTLLSPEVFSTWEGTAAGEARTAAGRLRTDIDSHGQEVTQVGNAAKQAEQEVETVKSDLQKAREFINEKGFVLDNGTGKVSYSSLQRSKIATFPGSNLALSADLAEAQREVSAAMNAADKADRDLALTIAAATGQAPVSALADIGSPLAPIDPNSHHLPGLASPSAGQPGQRQQGTTTRIFPDVTVPPHFNDPNMASDLARAYGSKVTFDPKNPGVKGTYSGNLMSPTIPLPGLNPMNPDGVGSIGINSDVNLEGVKGITLRADSATPYALHTEMYNGKPVLAVDYKYDYSISKTTVVSFGSVPAIFPEKWSPLSPSGLNTLTSANPGRISVPTPQ